MLSAWNPPPKGCGAKRCIVGPPSGPDDPKTPCECPPETVAAYVAELKHALRDIASNWDHDEDGHKYNTSCKICLAEKVLGLPPTWEGPYQLT